MLNLFAEFLASFGNLFGFLFSSCWLFYRFTSPDFSYQSQRVAAPTLSPVGGSYTGTPRISVSTSTTRATVRYTLDGSASSETTGTIYSGLIALTRLADEQASPPERSRVE